MTTVPGRPGHNDEESDFHRWGGTRPMRCRTALMTDPRQLARCILERLQNAFVSKDFHGSIPERSPASRTAR